MYDSAIAPLSKNVHLGTLLVTFLPISGGEMISVMSADCDLNGDDAAVIGQRRQLFSALTGHEYGHHLLTFYNSIYKINNV